MPIVSNNTDLNTIKYERNSGPSLTPSSIPTTTPLDPTVPYITVPIPRIGDKLPSTNDFIVNRVDGSNRLAIQTNLEGLFGSQLFSTINNNNSSVYNNNFIRGGILGAQQAIIRDYNRINAFIRDNKIFSIKQDRLQRSNVLFEGKGDQKYTYDINNRPTLIYNTNITLKQVAENAYGVHNLRHGNGNDNQETYYSNVIANAQFINNSISDALKTNRLLHLYNRPELHIQSNSKTLGGVINVPRSSTSPPLTSTVSNRNPSFFGGLLSRGSRGGTRLVTLNELKQRAQNTLVNFENRVNQIVGRTALGSVTLSSLQALGINTNVSLTNRLGVDVIPRTFGSINTNDPLKTLYLYNGGPDSLYGVGQTVIKRYEFTGDPNKIKLAYDAASQKAGKAIYSNEQQSVELTYVAPGGSGSILQRALGDPVGGNTPISTHPEVITDISEIAKAIGQSPLGPPNVRTYASIVAAQKTPLTQTFNKLGIFNTIIDKSTYSNVGNYSDVRGNQIEYRNTYNAKVTLKEKSWSRVAREERVGSGTQDSINLTPLFTSEIGFKNPKSKLKIGNGEYTVNDLVTFKIEGIDTDKPSKSVHMLFRAYITDFSDGVNAEWGDVTYAGRGDKFYIYKGFDRKIEIGFKVAALSSGEMKPMYQKLNNLMGNLLPDYQNSVMRGPLVRMTVGNWIDSQPGILTSLSYTIPQDSPWEISIEDQEKMVLPHVVEVKLSFTPIGAQHKKENKIMNKASQTLHTSYIAQNYNGDGSGEPNYIDGSNIGTATPYDPPETTVKLSPVTGSSNIERNFSSNPLSAPSTITRTLSIIPPGTPASRLAGDITDAEYAALQGPSTPSSQGGSTGTGGRRRRGR